MRQTSTRFATAGNRMVHSKSISTSFLGLAQYIQRPTGLAIVLSLIAVLGFWPLTRSAQAQAEHDADKTVPACEKPSDNVKPSKQLDEQAKATPKSAKRQPWVPLGRETTFFTEPLDEQGYVDYAAALSSYLGKGVTPNSNAYVLILRAIGPNPPGEPPFPAAMYQRLGIEPLPDKGDYFVPLDRYAEQTLKLKEKEQLNRLFEQERAAQRQPWKARDYPHIASWLKANEKPLALVQEAVQRPHYFRPWVRYTNGEKPKALIQVPLSEQTAIRMLARALMIRSMLHLGESDYDAAWSDLMTVLRLARKVGQSSCIEALVGISIETSALRCLVTYLQHARLKPETWRGRLKELQNLPTRKPLAEILNSGERILALDFLQEMHRQKCGLGDADLGPLGELLAHIQLAGFPWAEIAKQVNYWYDQYVIAFRQPDRLQRIKAVDKTENEVVKAVEKSHREGIYAWIRVLAPKADPEFAKYLGSLLSTLSLPSFRRVDTAYDRAQQLYLLVQIGLALEIYRSEKGQFPQRLQDLVPQYLPNVPKDIFSGQDPIYIRNDRGYLLYSVGPNSKDDGGRTEDDMSPGDDIRITLARGEK
ncbi:MAG: hypothetical protein RMI91_07570 [Gemmatales bacterium]|nr:hypothetical protein [Gemmatales bacterium]MDW7994499.1 hypothetical protein [Gemmatales bacterium]